MVPKDLRSSARPDQAVKCPNEPVGSSQERCRYVTLTTPTRRGFKRAGESCLSLLGGLWVKTASGPLTLSSRGPPPHVSPVPARHGRPPPISVLGQPVGFMAGRLSCAKSDSNDGGLASKIPLNGGVVVSHLTGRSSPLRVAVSTVRVSDATKAYARSFEDKPEPRTWTADIIHVLWDARPYMTMDSLVRRLWALRNRAGLKPPKAFVETVQSTLNHHTSQSMVWVKNGSRGRPLLFADGERVGYLGGAPGSSCRLATG